MLVVVFTLVKQMKQIAFGHRNAALLQRSFIWRPQDHRLFWEVLLPVSEQDTKPYGVQISNRMDFSRIEEWCVVRAYSFKSVAFFQREALFGSECKSKDKAERKQKHHSSPTQAGHSLWVVFGHEPWNFMEVKTVKTKETCKPLIVTQIFLQTFQCCRMP